MALSNDLNAIPRLFGDAVEQLGKLVQNEVQLARAAPEHAAFDLEAREAPRRLMRIGAVLVDCRQHGDGRGDGVEHLVAVGDRPGAAGVDLRENHFRREPQRKQGVR